jgi:hypothetical protein
VSARSRAHAGSRPAGAYGVTIDLKHPTTTVTATKQGYEPSRHSLSLDPNKDTVRDLRLHEVRIITAGNSVELAINPDDPRCGFGLLWCRRFRVISSQGALTLEVAPDKAAAQFGIVGADEEPGLSTSSRLTVPVIAGVERAFDIVIFRDGGDWPAPQRFTLHTWVEPN